MRFLRWAGIYSLCFVVVLFVRVGLWFVRYQTIRSILVTPCKPVEGPSKRMTVARVVRAIDRVAKYVPDASCLTQSIACQVILSWKNIPTTVSIGAASDQGDFKAHAWVTWNGEVVLDGDAGTPHAYGTLLELPTPSA